MTLAVSTGLGRAAIEISARGAGTTTDPRAVPRSSLLRLLSDATQPYGVKQLAEQLGVSKPTIERDLATLC